jgi:DNA-directed RNA polymerase beta' subunit
MKKNYNDRSLPYFFKNDDRAESRGFIEKPFMRGLNLPNFIFHHLSSREGLIDQTVRSVTGDTKIIILENSKPKVVEIGSWIDEHLAKVNPDFKYENDQQALEDFVNVNWVWWVDLLP